LQKKYKNGDDNMETSNRVQETDREPEFFTPEELAAKLNMSRKFIEKHISTRRLPGMVRVGRRWRFRRAEVEKRLMGGSFLLETFK
jgi:excisionase family DNA binding protein